MRGSMGNIGQAGHQASRRRSREWEIQDAVAAPTAGGGRPEPVPSRAVENARRFLWDEDEEDDAGVGHGSYAGGQSSSSFADRPPIPSALPGHGSARNLGLGHESLRMAGSGGGGGRESSSRRGGLFDASSSSMSASSRALARAAMTAPPGYHLDERTVKPIKVPKKDGAKIKMPKASSSAGDYRTDSATSRGTASTATSWSESIRNFFNGSADLSPAPPMLEPYVYSGSSVPRGYPADARAFLAAFDDKQSGGEGGLGRSVQSAMTNLGTSIRQTFVTASASRTGDAPPLQRGSETLDFGDPSTQHVASLHHQATTDDGPGGFAACCTSAANAVASRRRAVLLFAVAAIVVIVLAVVVPESRRSKSQGGQPGASSFGVEADEGGSTLQSSPTSTLAPTLAPTLTPTLAPTSTVAIEALSDGDGADTTTAPTVAIYLGGASLTTAAPTPSPAADFVSADRLAAMKARIVSSGVSYEAALGIDDTPQNEALKWLSYVDPANLDPDNEFVVQRYFLAVFYFSTHLDKPFDVRTPQGWTNWMTSAGYCSWFGIKCHHREGTDPTETTYDGNGGITELNLTASDVHGRIPREVAALEDLRVLDLGQNSIASTIPKEIGTLGSLLTLYLGENEITGTIPTELGLLTECTHMYLDNNSLEGTIPTEFGALINVHMMGLYDNALTGTIPDMSNLKDLRDLYLDSNQLSGQLPATLGQLASLKDLRLGSNNFSGSIPPEICDLTSLTTLYLEQNSLSNTLPLQIYKLQSLEELQAYENFLNGEIPHSISLLTNLEVLYLDDNELSGTIAPSIANLGRLNQLYLNNNFLEGEIPEEIGHLVHLEKVHLHSNALSGTVPLDVCSLKDLKLVELQSDCSGAAPEVTCDCCTECF